MKMGGHVVGTCDKKISILEKLLLFLKLLFFLLLQNKCQKSSNEIGVDAFSTLGFSAFAF